MKKSFLSAIGVLLLSVALLVLGGSAAPAQQKPAGATAAAQEQEEKHPEIHAAITHLEEAKRNLEKGAHDFGGHRVKALEHTNQALEECRQALAYDKK